MTSVDNGLSDVSVKVKRTPLPKVQLGIVFFVQFAEPICAALIYPYVVQLIRETGITGGDEEKVGHYAGLLEALFFATEALTVLQWGRASDRFGRKPILAISMLISAISILIFGFTKNYWILLVARAFLGIGNGAIGVAKTVTAEITDHTNLARATSLTPAMWSIGTMLGPAIGGFLARPADRWPNTIGKIQIFKDLPYLLPSLAAASVPIIALVVVVLFLNETVPSAVREKQNRQQGSRPYTETDPLLSETGAEEPSKPLPPIKDILTRSVVFCMVNYGFLSFLNMCHTALMPLQYSTSIKYGGLNLTSAQIGAALATEGIGGGIITMLFLERAISRWSAYKVYAAMTWTLIPIFAAYPLMHFLAHRAGYADTSVFIVLAIQLALSTSAYVSFACMFLFITDCSPSREVLGTINGLAQLVASGLRTIGPVFASSLFAFSQEYNVLGGALVYVILSVLVLVQLYTVTKLPRRLASDDAL